jgi:hypothetical protein
VQEAVGNVTLGNGERIGRLAIIGYGQVHDGQFMRVEVPSVTASRNPRRHLRRQTFLDFLPDRAGPLLGITNGITTGAG